MERLAKDRKKDVGRIRALVSQAEVQHYESSLRYGRSWETLTGIATARPSMCDSGVACALTAQA